MARAGSRLLSAHVEGQMEAGGNSGWNVRVALAFQINDKVDQMLQNKQRQLKPYVGIFMDIHCTAKSENGVSTQVRLLSVTASCTSSLRV